MKTYLLCLGATLAICAGTSAQTLARAPGTPTLVPEADVRAFALRSTEGEGIAVEVTNVKASSFLVLASQAPFNLKKAFPLGAGAVSQGSGLVVRPMSLQGLPRGFAVEFCAMWSTPGGGLFMSPPAEIPLTAPPGAQTLDFNFAPGLAEPVPGQVIDDEYQELGITVAAENNRPAGPDLAIIFDSANPTGGDLDLATPNLGNLLIIAENAVDMNGDGLIDDPDDENAGGRMIFDFAEPVEINELTVVDIDTDETNSFARFTHSDSSVTTLAFPNLGDGSIQTLSFSETDVVRMEIVMQSSGGLGPVSIVACPFTFDFNEDPFGRPNTMNAGQHITQLPSVGVKMKAENARPAGPDLGILFDSANPTGGDFDLQTPGPGIGNTEELGMLMIVAENDLDMNGDGLVDDPDDEFAGGQIFFDFEFDVTWHGATLVDIDKNEFSWFDLFDENGSLLATVPALSLGDNSVQEVTPNQPVENVRQVVLNLDSSGGIANMTICPESE